MASFEVSSITRSLKGPDSKHVKMKQLVNAIQEYFKTKREDIAISINMLLQNLSVTIDLSVFDPHTNIASQFFVSLYELMNKMEERSTFAWNCVDLLINASRNPAARHALIHTYQFIPSLSRLLSDQISEERKLRLLRLMQDLTCGIKISWQIPHLQHLMVTLTNWIENSNEEITTLSLGILVNLCYKNLPAVYTLMGNVDVKKIISVCSQMNAPTIEIHTCKMLIILDHMNGNIPKGILLKLTAVTFKSIIESYKVRDAIVLRQIVEFFLDVGTLNSLDCLLGIESYGEQLSTLLDVLQNNHSMDTGDACDSRDPECIALVFEFLNFLIENKLATIHQKFPIVIQIALKWIHTNLVSSQALAVLKSIAINVETNNNEILKPLIEGLPLFLATLNSGRSSEVPGFIEQNKKLTGLFQLLIALTRVVYIRPKILNDLKVETICKLFGPLLGDDGGAALKENDSNSGDVECINFHIYGIALVNELAKHDANWMHLYVNFMQQKQIHLTLAQALFECPKSTKTIVLEVASNPNFPHAMIAEALASLQPMVALDSCKKSRDVMSDLTFPVLSVSQVQKIDHLVAKLEQQLSQKQEMSVLTSDVIELYDFKLASMGNAERAAMASLEAASEQCTHLQHRNAQLMAEMNRLYQLLYHVQQLHEQASRVNEELTVKNEKFVIQVETDKIQLKTFKSQLNMKEEELNTCKMELDTVKKRLDKVSEERRSLDEANAQLKLVVSKLEDNSKKLEKNLMRKEEALKKNNHALENLNMKAQSLESDLIKTQGELQQKSMELATVRRELEDKQQILDTITKFAMNSQRPLDQ